MSPRLLSFLFETPEAARMAIDRLADAGLISDQFEVDADVSRYGIRPRRQGEPCILRVHVAPHLEARVAELLCDSGARDLPRGH